jgi:predicted Zn-dependent peptidase
MSQTETFRSQAPAPLSPHPIIVPIARETVLSNGLTVVVVEDPRLPLISYRLALRVGSSYDPPKLPA